MQLESLDVPLNLVKKGFDVGIAGAVAGVAALAGVVAGMVKLTFDWANELDGLGDVIGGTTEEVAALGFVARKSGVGVDAFTKANVALEKGLVKADGTLDTAGKSLKDYGINVKDANGNLKDQVALTGEISKKYASLATQQEKVNFLTEIYGKQGASLIDFFDTLNSEGGISAVEEKVKRLGLAIDPTRYEMFNRNLEELKLIGTGIAVSFTEKLMPALEDGLELITTFANASPAEKMQMLADGFKRLFNLTDAFKNGVDDIDWDGISKKLAQKVKNVDWGEVGLYVRQGVSNVLEGIGTVIDEIDWDALADASGEAFADLVAGLYGYANWDALKVDFNNGFVVAFDYAKNHAFADFRAWTHNEMMNIGEVLFNAIVNASAPIERAWDNLIESMKNKWLELINEILSFGGINIQAPSLGGTASGGTGGGSAGGGGKGGRRASGGAVIAGQTYDVAEFSKPEKFTPNQSGRVDASKPQIIKIDETTLATVFGRVLGEQLQRKLG